MAIGTAVAVAGLAYTRYKYSNRADEYQTFTNTMLGVEGIHELSTYIEETQGQADLRDNNEPVPTDDDETASNDGLPVYPGPYNLAYILKTYSPTRFPVAKDASNTAEINHEGETLVGIRETDGNIKNSTSTYIQDKTRVTNHRRVMYRQRNTFTNALVSQVKLSIDWKTRDAANEKVARKMIKDAMAEHGLSITDSVRTFPIAIEAVFMPNDAEIYANEWRHSAAVARRIARYYAPEEQNLSSIRWMWNNYFGVQATEQSGGRLNTMDEPFKTPLSLTAEATGQPRAAARPPLVD